MKDLRSQPDVVSVTVQLYDGSRTAALELPTAVKVAEFLHEVRSRWHLPEERDYRIVYSPRGSGQGEDAELPDDAMFAACGVKSGGSLTVYPVLVAGGRAFAFVRAERLRAEQAALQELVADHPDVLQITATEGTPPHTYELSLRCSGIVAFDGARECLGTMHRARISYPATFPRPGTAPEARFLTPVLHVNVFPNWTVCLGRLTGPDEPVDSLVTRLVGLLQHEPSLIGLDSAANYRMVAWTKANMARFPLGTALTRRARKALAIRWTDL